MKRIFFTYTIAALLSSLTLADDNLHDAVTLNQSDLTESSGLAMSLVHQSRWWTHNDSGGKARLFAFNQKGKSTGSCRLKGVDAVDWEDMASFTDGQQARLIVADFGDNKSQRESIQLYLLNEPDPNDDTKINDFQTLTVTYSDGPQNCEAIAVDVDARKIILISKEKLPMAGVYRLNLPRQSDADEQAVVAERITTVPIPMISAMDRDSLSGDLWIINYFQAFHYPKSSETQTLSEQLRQLPTVIDLPKWKQIEAVAVDDEHQVWITSEGKSAPMGRIKLK